MRSLIVIFATFLLVIGNLRAQEPNSDQTETTINLKSENLALHLSLWSTVGPIVTGIALTTWHVAQTGDTDSHKIVAGMIFLGSGMMFGPSIGYFYGDKVGRGLGGIGVRSLIVLGTSPFLVLAGLQDALSEDPGRGFKSLTTALIVTGGLLVAHDIFDILKVKSNVRARNEKKRKAVLSVAPLFLQETKSSTYGLQIAGNF